ncbi:hypothetical protein [Pararhizobium sp. PWRC1-1]|uniref:hypothetical protein n=1 Tax=Pararhizobium sp. PWRC1-1 TaxID=2804566 RepID=UPI003CE9F6E3
MAQVQFDDIEGEIHVYATFASGHEIIDFGDAAVREVLAELEEGHCFEIKSIYENLKTSSLEGFTVTFIVDETNFEFGVRELKAVVGGFERYLGTYFVFAEGGGTNGLLEWAGKEARQDA